MNQRMIRHLINGVIFTAVYYFVGRDVGLEQAAVFGVLYFVISMFIERLMTNRQAKRVQNAQRNLGSLDEVTEALVNAVGGKENIESVSSDVSRLKITLADVEQADQEALKTIATNGAYLSGNQLQIPLAVDAEQVASEIQGMINS